MSGAKIQLSLKEQELLADTGIILTKNRILTSVIDLMGTISAEETAMAERLRDRLPVEFFKSHPKISRGENYLGLPWVMLDYPRNFDQEGMLVIRQFCWWGNFFSSTLLVSGKFKDRLLAASPDWPAGTLICLQHTPWEHHLGKDATQPIHAMSTGALERLLTEREFLKLSLVRPVSKWEGVTSFYLEGFRNWLNLLVA